MGRAAAPAGASWETGAARGAPRERGRGAAARDEQRGARAFLSRVAARASDDRLSIISAGVAFYALLAVFPGLAALISIYGLAFDPHQVERQLAAFSAMLPPQAAEVVLGQLRDVAGTDRTALGLAALGGLVLTLWSAAAGIKTLMTALNVAYHEQETRGFLKFSAVALALTLAGILGAAIAIAAVVAIPAVLAFLHLDELLGNLISYARWPVLALAMILGLGLLYRYGPSRSSARAPWFSWGAVAATFMWLAGSALFSFYVTRFGNYNETYGSVGAIVILLLWFLLTSYAVLLGAEINAELEARERREP